MSPARPSLRDRLRGWRRRLGALVRRDAADREMATELAFHLDMETEQNVRAGMDRTAARRAARIAFGGPDRFSDEVRDVRAVGWLDDLIQDLKHAARGARRSPGFTAAAVAALSLGIGANAAVFSLVYGVLIAPLPYAEPDRLVRLWESNAAQRIDRGYVSPGTFTDLWARSHTLSAIALFGERTMLLSNDSDTWETRAAAVSPELFDVLGVRPIIGRTLLAQRTAAAPQPGLEVVISHRIWMRRFGGAPDVVGRTIRLDYRWTHTIVGVMPPGFAFPADVEAWVPLVYSRAVAAVERQYRYYGAIAKLRDGVTLEQASIEASGIATQLQSEYPASNAGWTVQLARLDDSIVGDARRALLVVLGLAACVLLIACANVATLAVARAAARRHETAVRIALGAGGRRLLRQWIAEGLLLAALGGVGGLAIGYWANRLLLAASPGDIPRLDEVGFGPPVFLAVLVLTFATAVIVGLAPAFRQRDTALVDAMRSRAAGAGSGGARTRAWLVGTQVAITLVLTVAAVLLLRSFERLRSTDLGFRRHDVVAAEIQVPGGRFPGAGPWFQRLQYYDGLMAELRRLPDVRSVAATTDIPLTGELGVGSMWRTDAPGAVDGRHPTSASDQWRAAIEIVTPGYFETMGIPFLRGRAFDAADRFTQAQLTDLSTPRPPGVVIINEAMAKRFWPDDDPLGKTIFVFDDKSFSAYRTVVGIVRDSRATAVAAAGAPTVFLPFAQSPGRKLSLVVRSSLPPSQLAEIVTNRLRAFDRSLAVSAVRPLETIVDGALSRPRFVVMLVGGFAFLALVIAGVGVFGIVGFLVTRRTQEIGIRMALGARRRSVLWLVMAEGLRPVVFGVVTGCLGAMLVARAMRALLYEVAPLDAPSFVASAALLLVASIVAALLPARRAAGVDPLLSLRSQ